MRFCDCGCTLQKDNRAAVTWEETAARGANSGSDGNGQVRQDARATWGRCVPVDNGRDGEDQSGDESSSEFDWGDSVLVFDPEVFNVQWSKVVPGVDYGPGNLAADLAADVLRGMYQDLEHRSALDRLHATTDEQGNPFVHVWLSAAGVIEIAELVRDGRRLGGMADARASDDWLSVAASRVRGGRGELAASLAAAAVREMRQWVANHSELDRVQAMKDLDGTALVYVCMNAPGMMQLAALVRDGRRLRAGVARKVR